MTLTTPETGRISSSEAFLFQESSGGIQHYRHRGNGLNVLLLAEAAAPVVTFMITYHVGSRFEALGLTGATHFLEHLMFKGTDRFNRHKNASVFQVLQRVGAQINATTWFDRTNYFELLPREHLPLAIRIEADRMRGALLNEEDIEKERTVILNEFDRGQNDPIRSLFHAVWSAAFVAHPYHHPTIGWRSDIEGVRRDGLRHFYDAFYWPNNATVSVIGDIEPEAVLAEIDARFGAIPASPGPIEPPYTREPEQRGERRLVLRRPGELGAVMVAFKSPRGLDTDTDALDVLSIILASGKSSRLFRSLTDQGVTTHVFATASRLHDPGLFYVVGLLSPTSTHAPVEEGILDAVRRIQADGVTPEEVRRAQNQIKAHEAFGRDGPYSVAAQLNEAIAAGDWKLYTTYLERIQAVTPADVQRVARTYLVDDARTVGHYQPL